MKPKNKPLLLLVLCLVMGCASPLTPTPRAIRASIAPRATVQPTRTSIAPSATAQPTPAPSPSAIPPSATAPITLTCALRGQFHVQVPPLDDISHLNFVDANTIAVAGWGAAPASAPLSASTPITTNTPHEYGNHIVAAHNTYYRAEVNLVNGAITPFTPAFTLLHDPCPGAECHIEILDQSPDGQWQLLHVWSSECEGDWLVGQGEALQLGGPPVPARSFWQWAQDGSLLWYQRFGPGYGLTAETLVVHLGTPPTLARVPVDWNQPLDSNGHNPVFSPRDKVALSTPRLEHERFSWPETKLYSFDLLHSLTDPTEQQAVPNLARVAWSESTQSYWLVLVQGDGVTFVEKDSVGRVFIPLNVLEDLYVNVASGRSGLIDFSPASNNAASGQRVALAMGGNRLFLFDCTNLE